MATQHARTKAVTAGICITKAMYRLLFFRKKSNQENDRKRLQKQMHRVVSRERRWKVDDA